MNSRKSPEDFGISLQQYREIERKLEASLTRKAKVELIEMCFFTIPIFLLFIHLVLGEPFDIDGKYYLIFPAFFIYIWVQEYLDRPICPYGKYTPPASYYEYCEYIDKYEKW